MPLAFALWKFNGPWFPSFCLELACNFNQFGLIRGAPLASIKQGSAVRSEQRHQVFSNHSSWGHSASYRQLKLAPAAAFASTFFGSLASQAKPFA
jgi:hypothetical protein